MRQIILDTETTGLLPEEGHRIIEIGCIELVGRYFTGNDFHVYINPERSIDSGALAVHGLTYEFLAAKPVFAEIAEEFLAYIKDAEIIVHNAPFDVSFLNYELKLLEQNAPKKEQKTRTSAKTIEKYVTVFDTLGLARKLHPGQRNSLDALCKRYKVDNTNRTLHGALLDARLLAEVYLAMTSGQATLFDDNIDTHYSNVSSAKNISKKPLPVRKNIKIISANNDDLEQHKKYLADLQKTSGKCLWKETEEN